MPERPTLNLRLEPTAARRLVQLAAKLSLSKSAVVHLALAELAARQGLDGQDGPHARA
jgi:predicted transcriptional regulator